MVTFCVPPPREIPRGRMNAGKPTTGVLVGYALHVSPVKESVQHERWEVPGPLDPLDSTPPLPRQ